MKVSSYSKGRKSSKMSMNNNNNNNKDGENKRAHTYNNVVVHNCNYKKKLKHTVRCHKNPKKEKRK